MEGASLGRLANPRPWSEILPPSVFDGLSEWIKGQPFDLTHCRWLTGGRSGSFVALVRMQPRRAMLHGAVLKLLPQELAARESRAVHLAEQYGPDDFVVSHLVRTTWVGPLPGSSGCWLHLQDVAQDDLAAMHELTRLIADPGFAEYCATIVAALSTAWNSGPDDPSPEVSSPGAFVRQDLSSKSAGLRTFADAAGLDFDQPPASIEFPGRTDPLPNPLALLTPGAADLDAVTVFRGKGHGDLNLGNVFVPVSQNTVRPQSFRLIDVGRFSPEMPVSRDPAKLLLSVAAAWLPGIAPESPLRSSLAEVIVAPLDCQPSPAIEGYLHVARSIYTAAASWAVPRRVVDDWARQHRLVLAAAALRTVSQESMNIADRWWHLEVAALALRPPVRPTSGSAQPAGDEASRPRTPSGGVVPSKVTPGSDGAMFPGSAKLEFCRRLNDDWADLADLLGIRPHERAHYSHGHEPRCIWDWLEVRGRLGDLHGALVAIGREDLAQALGNRIVAR